MDRKYMNKYECTFIQKAPYKWNENYSFSTNIRDETAVKKNFINVRNYAKNVNINSYELGLGQWINQMA